ncbi:MAG: DUF1116 domain-containing protein, partial [Betaproteobacteria bacterium]|nr:DUF1116 domain-containing protein [Betaproteobacteria bacterium]
MKHALFARTPAILNLGLERLAAGPRLAGAAVAHIDWRPVGDGDPALARALARLAGETGIDAANDAAVARMLAARPRLVDVVLRADEVWPRLWAGGARTLTHAGAPLAWDAMCEPMKGTLIGAMLYEGWARDEAEARARLAAGEVRFVQNHDLGAVGPMSGTISPSMPLFVVRDAAHGHSAYTNLSEGIGRVLRFGAFGPEVITKLRWLGSTVAPALKAALAGLEGGVDLRSIQSQALLMGDEVHSRNAAATALFHMAIGGALAGGAFDRARSRETLDFIAATSQFFLNLSMAASKAIMDAAHGVARSSIVTAIARNGVTSAIRVSGLAARWFEAPADVPTGLYFAGFAQHDANPDLGDSAICETAGYGGQSLAAAPALVQLAGGTVADAIAITREMHDIAWARNPDMALPYLDFAGAPAGIDVRKVVDNGIRPVLTTGIAHRQAGIGQIGAGMVRVPMACFTQALRA